LNGTGRTWNPSTGCDKISAGCKNCYAEVMSRRLKGMGQEKYKDGFKFRIHYDSLQDPYKWKKPQVVFVNSMSDLFHMQMPFTFLYKVFEVMMHTPQHTYQVLTKRADRLHELNDIYFHLKRNYPDKTFPLPNVWVGVSVENQQAANERIPHLQVAPVAVRFLSCEPLLGPVNLDVFTNIRIQRANKLHWVICGGESGAKARPMHPDWARSLCVQCEHAGIPFFFKQWGGVNKKKAGRLLDGEEYNEMPTGKKESCV
jgi:protein gp37